MSTNTITLRLEELAQIQSGWLDGIGVSLNKQGLQWLAAAIEANYSADLPLPHLFPTAEGRIRAEWSLGNREISLEIDIENKVGEWHELDLDTDTDNELSITFDSEKGWETINNRLSLIQSSKE